MLSHAFLSIRNSGKLTAKYSCKILFFFVQITYTESANGKGLILWGKLQAESPVCIPKLPFCNLKSCFVSEIPAL